MKLNPHHTEPRFYQTSQKQGTVRHCQRGLLDAVKAYYGHIMRKQGSCLEKEIMQGTMQEAYRQGRPHTAWTWKGLPVEE